MASYQASSLQNMGHNQAAAYFTLIPHKASITNLRPVHPMIQADHVISPCIIPMTGKNFVTNKPDSKEPAQEQSVSIFQRFKNAYKEYGKVLIGVHCVTSAGWFGMFYYAATKGVDVVPILENMGAGEKIIKPFQSGAGDLAVMYLLYKLATPARYTVTIVGTQYTVKYLRRYGYMEEVPEGDSIRNLMKDGREKVKDKVDDQKEKLKDKADEMKDRCEARKDKLKDKLSESKDKLKDAKVKLEEGSEKLKDKAQDYSNQLEKEKLKHTLGDAKSKLKESFKDTVHEMKDMMDSDENVQEAKKKLAQTTHKVKAGASDMKQKMDKNETVRDVKKNLDRATDKMKDKAYELKKKMK